MDKTKADFGGYVTKTGLKCSDGRTIMPDAFKHMDGQEVPLVWAHGHHSPDNVLGKLLLEHRDDGVYGYGFFNETPPAKQAKALVHHRDIKNLSIYANQLTEKAKQVFHGFIKEGSLVLSGANPGALIDFIAIQHDGEPIELEDEAIIYTDAELEHSAVEPEGDGQNGSGFEEFFEHAEGDTLKAIYDGLDEDEKNLVHFMIGTALEAGAVEHSETPPGNDGTGNGDQEGTGEMTHQNVFETHGRGKEGEERHVLSHDDVRGIVMMADKMGSMREAVEAYSLKHGIENIDLLFPDAKMIQDRPEFISRRMEWVAGVLNGTRKSPVARIKTMAADITHDEARAKGYVKGELKKDEYFGLTRRTTGPTTVYKKQKLDRDDIIDITDLDVVAWMKGEMRVMLDEEVARAILIGDGRAVDDPDKIRDPMGAAEGTGIRSILNDHELFVTTLTSTINDANPDYNVVVEDIMRGRRFYKGSGSPTFYTTNQVLVEMLLSKDAFGRRRWLNDAELARDMRVKEIVEVEVMDQADDDLLGIIVNLNDYVVGTDRGGEVSMFDDFDIDYNQYKYLIEGRASGALVKIKSAMVIRRAPAGSEAIVPVAPLFNDVTGDITIPAQAGTTYSVDGVVQVDGAVVNVAEGDTAVVTAVPDAGRHFANNVEDEWIFENNSA